MSREDHTRIVYVVVANAAQVRRKVTLQRPSGSEALQAVLQTEGVDSYTRARIEAVLRLLTEIEPAQEKIPSEEAAALDEIAARLAASPTVTTKSLLLGVLDAETLPEGRYSRFRGVNSGLITAERLAGDGLTTIYSVDWVYTALAENPVKMIVHLGSSTEIGGGVAGDFALIWAFTKSVFEQSVTGAMRGAAAYYAAGLRGATVAEYATAGAVGASVREILLRID